MRRCLCRSFSKRLASGAQVLVGGSLRKKGRVFLVSTELVGARTRHSRRCRMGFGKQRQISHNLQAPNNKEESLLTVLMPQADCKLQCSLITLFAFPLQNNWSQNSFGNSRTLDPLREEQGCCSKVLDGSDPHGSRTAFQQPPSVFSPALPSSAPQ